MKTILEHQFQTKAHSLTNLFEDVQKMSTFMRRLEADAQLDPLRYDPAKYVGDGFEFFVELFLMLHPTDNRVGLSSYSPIQDNDNGVDGIGFNIDGQKSVAQIKYRSNTQWLLTATEDHLSNMFSDGMLTHDVVANPPQSKVYRHFVYTTATGLHFYTDQEMFKGKVKCIGYNDFRSMLDNNKHFWTEAMKVIQTL